MILELPDTFLGQKPNLKIARPEIQEDLVKEISTSLQQKAGAMFPKPGSGGKGKAGNKPRGTGKPKARVSAPKPKPKKGVLGWVKSLFD
jgi:hypothetical protein